VRSVMRGGVCSQAFREESTAGNGRCKGIGRGGGEFGGEGGCEGARLGMVRWCGDGGKTGNSCAPFVKGRIGFPGPQ
jgi:hypothetical protein